MDDIDTIIAPLINRFRETAQSLVDGLPVSDDDLRRYNGATGLMLLQAHKALWTREELKAEIDARVRLRCAECQKAPGMGNAPPAARLLALLVPYRWPAAVIAFSPFAAGIIEKINACFN